MKLILLLAAALLPLARGHGYVTSPRGRPWRAHQDGASCKRNCNVAGGIPLLENCPHCLNRKDVDGVCGKTNTQSYEEGSWLDINGNQMPWLSEESVERGMTMNITTALAAHHNGHMELRACPKCTGGETASTDDCFVEGTLPLQACFDANPFTFVKDYKNTYGQDGDADFLGALPDDTYPERGYYSPKLGNGGNAPDPEYIFEYEVSANLFAFPAGDALLQYIYVTGNACNSAGYDEYFLDAVTTTGDNRYDEWWKPGLSECVETSDTGTWRQCDCGERFWNCVEVTLV